MKLGKAGTPISQPEVTNISPHGLWLLIDEEELFMPFDHFPWFQHATLADVLKLEQASPDHLYWPALDVDISIVSIRDPQKFPLVSTMPVCKK